MFTITGDAKPNIDYQTEYISTTGAEGVDWFRPSRIGDAPCGIDAYRHCPFRLPCGRCRKTGQMCPIGYYITW